MTILYQDADEGEGEDHYTWHIEKQGKIETADKHKIT